MYDLQTHQTVHSRVCLFLVLPQDSSLVCLIINRLSDRCGFVCIFHRPVHLSVIFCRIFIQVLCLCFNRLSLLLGLFSSLDTLAIDPFKIHGLADVTLDCLPSSWRVRRQVVFRPTSKGSQLWFPKIYFIAGVFLSVKCRR